MFCRYCGEKIDTLEQRCHHCNEEPLKGSQFCQFCGEKTQKDQEVCDFCYKSISTEKKEIDIEEKPKKKDQPDPMANLAGFCCFPPIVGLVLYFLWRNERPNTAKSVLAWTTIAFAFIVIYFIASFIIGIIFDANLKG